METKNKTRYSDQELEEFKALINKKLEDAIYDFEFLKAELLESTENGDATKIGDWEEGGKTSELEYLSTMAARRQQYIKYLKNALIRIANKSYGICTVTGQLISKERLRLVPHATKSVEGKKIESS